MSHRALFAVVFATAAIVPGGCNCGVKPLAQFKCDFEVTPSGEGQAIEFISTPIGSHADRTFRIANTGNVSLTDLSFVFETVNGDQFHVDAPDDFAITGGESETLTVVFAPLAEAEFASRFVVSHPAVGSTSCPSATVFVRGTGFRELEVDAGTDAGTDAGPSDAGPFDDAGFVDAGEIDRGDAGVVIGPDAEWFAYGGLEDARTRFGAVQLQNGSGQVIAVGGYGEDGQALDSIERFNPETGISRVVAHTAVPRAEPAVALLDDGRIAIVGGRTDPVAGFALTSVEIYNPADDTVLCPAPQNGCGLDALDVGVLPVGRIGAFATSQGSTLLVGLGRTLDDDANEIPLAGGETIAVGGTVTSGAIGNAGLLTARTGDARVVDDASGKLIVVAGKDVDGNLLNDVLVVDPGSSSVGGLPVSLSVPRALAAAALLQSGDLVVAGGLGGVGIPVSQVERVKSVFGSPTVVAIDVPARARIGGVLLALSNDILLSAGGLDRRTDGILAEDSVLPLFDADVLVPFGVDDYLRLSPENGLAQGRFESRALVVNAGRTQALLLGGTSTVPRRTPHPHAERFLLDQNRFSTYGLMGQGTALEAGLVEDSGAALLSVGGLDPHTGRISGDVRAFDATHGTFVAAGALDEPRKEHTATRLQDDVVILVAGGRDESGQVTGSISLYNPLTLVERTLSIQLTTPRAGHTATRLADDNPVGPGALVVCGGQGAGGEPLDTCEVILPPSNPQDPSTFDEAAVIPVLQRLSAGRFRHTATLLDSGEVLLAGGTDVTADLVRADLFIPDDNEPYLVSTGLPVRARRDHAAVLLGGGRVLVVGGDVQDGVVGASRSAELYIRALDAFMALPDMEEERAAPAAVLLADGNVLVAGGTRNNFIDSGRPTRSNVSAELYIAGADGVGTFEALPDLPLSFGRSDVRLVDVFGRAIVTGGTHRDGTLQSGAERRTPVTFVDFLQNRGDEFRP